MDEHWLKTGAARFERKRNETSIRNPQTDCRQPFDPAS
jgi:hypothetical protein